MSHVITLNQPVGTANADQCVYASAFLVPGILAVELDGDTWTFTTEHPVATDLLKERLAAIVQRYTTDGVNSETIMEFLPECPEELPGLENSTNLGQEIALGLNVFDAPFARIVRFLDDAMLRRFGAEFPLKEENYPNVIPMKSLSRANHLSSFPEHLNFISHLDSDVSNLDAFAELAGSKILSSSDSAKIRFAPSELVHNPSTCYHCYARRENDDIETNTAVTAITKCHRYEASNHSQLGRLMEFSLREVIFLGTPDYVRETRSRCLDLIADLAKDWSIFGSLISASDPFFSSDYSSKSTHQHRLALKYEYKALLPPHGSISILSSNLHGPTFSKAFSITQGGRPINTGCIGFGLERFAFVILAQHGADPDKWPARLQSDFGSWCANDPLS